MNLCEPSTSATTPSVSSTPSAPSVTSLDPADSEPTFVYGLLMSVLVPRGVAWVSTVSADGVPNLAPFGWNGAVSGHPPILHFTSRPRHGGDETAPRWKDSWVNAVATGGFVVNVASVNLQAALNTSSAEVGPEVDEFHLAGVTPVSGEAQPAPRVAEAAVSIECRTHSTHEIGESVMTFGQVVRIHVLTEVLAADGWADLAALDPLAKLGRQEWGRTVIL